MVVGDQEGSVEQSFRGRTIVILSDGTGQRGGLTFDERRSNIYKLYRATRTGPDSSVDGTKQTAFYDPGIGTLPGGIDSPAAFARTLYNVASQATGMGITRNITDCYAEIIRVWRPGDRIFLFGFSRGAYTVRCLGGVLRYCGVPVQNADGTPIKRDPKSIHRLAREGVHVYNYTNSRPAARRTKRQNELLQQRALLADGFRSAHGCDGANGGNARPYFIGVFDTVASLSNPQSLVLLAAGFVVLIALLSLAALFFHQSYWRWFFAVTLGALAVAVVGNLLSRLRWAPGLKGIPWWRTVHLATARMKMYDTELDPAVEHARHAIAIDERRASFARVPWGTKSLVAAHPEGWFEQVWFAGDHSDIGGGYAEDEGRLSDITLQWMSEAAADAGLACDPSVLRCYPSATGMQHDEAKSSIFRFARKKVRVPDHDAPLHPSVIERFKAAEVLQYDVLGPYRPEGLRNHEAVKQYY